MKLINSEGIEDTLLKAIAKSQESYKQGVSKYLEGKDADLYLSVTTLAKPVQAHYLTIRHWDEIEKDARQCYPTLIGSIFHAIAEDNAMPGDVVEKRYGRTLSFTVGEKTWKVHVHGACDRYNLELGYMKDYKFTSMIAMNYSKEDYEQQLNILRFLLPTEEKNKIKTLSNIFVFRDFRFSDVQSNRSPQPTFTKELTHPIWTDEKCKQVLRERLGKFLQSVHLPDNELPECSREELWYSKSGFRIRHKTKKQEWSKVSSGWAETEEEANSIAEAKKPGTKFRLERTEGSPRRCSFCDALKFCSQNKRLASEESEEEEIEI